MENANGNQNVGDEFENSDRELLGPEVEDLDDVLRVTRMTRGVVLMWN